MNTTKIIRGTVNSKGFTITPAITQGDYGYIFIPEIDDLPALYRLDFSNDEHHGTSLPVYCGSEGGEVPEELIDTGKDIFVWFFYIGDGYGITEYKWRIPNKCKPKAEQDEPAPTQQSSIDQLIVRSNEAVTSAEQSASAAGQSAQNASRDAGRAEQAKTDAETAQRKAEETQESAERAKDDAETSERNASESERKAKGYAETASEKADSIHSMTVQATTLPDGSSATASYDAETGVMLFGIPKGKDGRDGTDGDDGYSPSASVTKSGKVVTITIADKNGTTSARVSDGEDGATGATPNLTIGTVETLEPTESATASITGTPENPVLNLGIPQGEQGEVTTEEFLKAFVTDTASGSIASFTDGADNIPLKSLTVNIDPVQDLSNGDPSPENICPISGWTGGNVNVSSKNLCNAVQSNVLEYSNSYSSYTLSNGTVTTGGNALMGFIVPVKPSTTYTYSFIKTTGNSLQARVRLFSGYPTSFSDNFISQPINTFVSQTATSASVTFETTAMTRYVMVGMYVTGASVAISNFQVKLGSTAAEYEPYKGRSIPISWQSEAGTVYGGKLDVLNGMMTAYPYYASYNGETLTGRWISDRDVYVASTIPTIGAQVVDMSGTGTEVQLTPHEVNSLLGVNNIFADTGDASVEYRADTKLYIERLTAPDSADMIADSNIVSGQYFMVGNSLYKATANIANGGQIIVGTNATRVSLAQALNEINA